MKKSTRSAVWLCLVLLAIATTPPVLSDEGDDEEVQPTTQEAVVEDEQDTNPAPEGDGGEVNEGEATDTEVEADGSDGTSVHSVAQPINILLAPTACKAGYRVDHKGKCRPTL
uniref:Uncharacterized protein n=1 Tax=Anopheles christyi TaxID=43041 RepID=A0A182K1F1_9DIPT